MPHIGETGLSLYLGDADICSRSVPEPNYDYAKEATLALERTRDLTDEQKVEAEFFDSKLSSLVAFQAQFFIKWKVTLDSFEYIQANASTYNWDFSDWSVFKENFFLTTLYSFAWQFEQGHYCCLEGKG